MVSSEILEATIREYNDYRGSMATAELAAVGDGTFAVRFEGPFCRMCCDYDYFEDLIYDLDDRGIDPDSVEITEIDYEGGESYRVAYAVTP